jgi:hypothetical protein
MLEGTLDGGGGPPWRDEGAAAVSLEIPSEGVLEGSDT